MTQSKWICCQLGAREHYAVPRALYRCGALDYLITDIWSRPGSLPVMLVSGLGDRFHLGLADACVRAPNVRALAFEARSRLRGFAGWKLICERNEWFQRRTIGNLARLDTCGKGRTFTLFAYSYAAEGILEFAHERGWRTVLGQIDPGPVEERIVAQLYQENQAYCGDWQPAPPRYWDQWLKECSRADRIVVNSMWSRDALVHEGVAAEKIRVVPLAFEKPPEAESFERCYPAAFTTEQPLRVLFLGQINLRKGVGPLLEAARLLRCEPVEFWFVGPVQIVVPAELKRGARMRWIGAVPRGEAAKYYRTADLFIFPTFSDGFGLTQLEAQAWKLPVLASQFCGSVVRDGVNGVLLREVSGEAIASVLLNFLRKPASLRDMAAHSGLDDRFSLDALASSFLDL